MNRYLVAVLAALETTADVASVAPARNPNIVWIIVDDMSPNFSCYGETTICTPNVDRLAAV